MRDMSLVCVACLVLSGLACHDGVSRSFPLAPTTAPVIPQAPNFPAIVVGQIVRFQFTAEDSSCVAGDGACRSYNVTAPSDGRLEIVLMSVSGEDGFIRTTEMYVVPGADSWDVGPGPRISATIPVKAGATYEIRMYSAKVPSVELELRASLQ